MQDARRRGRESMELQTILDIMMPGISGLRVCEELCKRTAVPILFLTALGEYLFSGGVSAEFLPGHRLYAS